MTKRTLKLPVFEVREGSHQREAGSHQTAICWPLNLALSSSQNHGRRIPMVPL